MHAVVPILVPEWLMVFLSYFVLQCCISGDMNRWRRKQRQFINCFDIHLKTIVLQEYRGTTSQVNFASFFLLNAKKLESMTLEVDNRLANDTFFIEQYTVLHMENNIHVFRGLPGYNLQQKDVAAMHMSTMFAI